MEKEILVGLVKGRHPINFLKDEDYIYDVVEDPSDIASIEARAGEWIKEVKEKGVEKVKLVVTGLTSCTIAVIKACCIMNVELECYHFNQSQPAEPTEVTLEKNYVLQKVNPA